MGKILKCLFVASIVAVSGYGISRSVKKDATKLNELTLANVEALAQNESGNEGKTCYNTVTSKDGNWVRYCPSCSRVEGTDPWYAPASTCE